MLRPSQDEFKFKFIIEGSTENLIEEVNTRKVNQQLIQRTFCQYFEKIFQLSRESKILPTHVAEP